MSSFYGGRPGNGFTLVKEYQTKQAMITDFKKGADCPVHYDQYVLVKETTNNNTDIKIYRRGYNFTNSDGGAEQIGSLAEVLNGASSGEVANIRQTLINLDASASDANKYYRYLTAGDAVRASLQGLPTYVTDTWFQVHCKPDGFEKPDFDYFPNNLAVRCGKLYTTAIDHAPPVGENEEKQTLLAGLIISIGSSAEERKAGDTQFFIPRFSNKIYYRQYNLKIDASGSEWTQWKFALEDVINQLPQYRSYVNKNHAEYQDKIYLYREDGTFAVSSTRDLETGLWEGDMPNNSGQIFAITNSQFTPKWIVQTAVGANSGNIYNRIIGTSTNPDNIYRNWYCLEASPKLKILAIGDSICFGARNNFKGFIGDIDPDALNIGISGAKLTDIVVEEGASPFKKEIQEVNKNNWKYEYKPSIRQMFQYVINPDTCPSISDLGQAINNNNLEVVTSDTASSSENQSNKIYFYKNRDGGINESSNAIFEKAKNYIPDVIIAEGGINDYFADVKLGQIPSKPVTNNENYNRLDSTTITGALQKLFYRMIQSFPNAQRYFLITHKTYDTQQQKYLPTTKNQAGYSQQDLHDAIVICCNLYGVKIIDVYNDSILDSAFNSNVSPKKWSELSNTSGDKKIKETALIDKDGVHPFANGYLQGYAPLIKAALKGNSFGGISSQFLKQAVVGGNQFLNIDKLMSLFGGDFNNIPNNRIYPMRMDFTDSAAASANITAASAHAPLQKMGGTLITLGRTVSENHQNGDVQIFTTPDGADWTGEILVREYWDRWNAWHSLTDSSKRVWKGLKISVLGDSISSYDGQSVGNAYNKPSKIPSVNSMWWKQLCRITGAEPLVIDAYASSCCAVASASWTSSITPGVDDSRCRALHTGSTSSGNRIDPDIILIALGLNDFQANVPLGSWDGHEALSSSDTATWRGAYANMLLKIHTEYPNALVFCLSPWFFVRGSSTDVNVNSGGNTYQDFEDAMREVCNILGGVYIDCSNFGFNRQNYSGSAFAINDNTNDGSYFHPNATGQEILGQSIAAAVKDKAVGYVNWLKAQRGI